MIEGQLCSIFDFLDTVRQQIAEIDKQLDVHPQVRFAPVFSGHHQLDGRHDSRRIGPHQRLYHA